MSKSPLKLQKKIKCIVHSCPNRQDKTHRFFRFPNKESAMFHVWANACSLSEREKSKSRLLICQKHFRNHEYNRYVRRGVVPSLFIGEIVLLESSQPSQAQHSSSTSNSSVESSSSEEIKNNPPDELQYTFDLNDSSTIDHQFDPLQIHLSNIKDEKEDEVKNNEITQKLEPINNVIKVVKCKNGHKSESNHEIYIRRWTKYQFLYKHKKRQVSKLMKKLDRLRNEFKTLNTKYIQLKHTNC